MGIVVHRFDPPERFVAGTVGPPGQRTFFLQARAGSRVTSVALEKEQVAVLAERLDEMLDELVRQRGTQGVVPAVEPVEMRDSAPLDQPIVEEFRAGTMTLAWDADDEVVVIEVFPVTEDGDDDDTGDAAATGGAGEPADTDVGGDPGNALGADAGAEDLTEVGEEIDANEVLLVRLPPATARSFAKRAATVVAAGRPPCPFCGGPVDPEGHLCPRSNGFRRIRT